MKSNTQSTTQHNTPVSVPPCDLARETEEVGAAQAAAAEQRRALESEAKSAQDALRAETLEARLGLCWVVVSAATTDAGRGRG
jgi:hypothetical protein